MRWLGRIAPLAWMAVGICCGCVHAQTVAISVAQNLSFPTIAIPQSSAVQLTISPLNSSTSGTASILYGTALRGQYNLSDNKKGGSGVAITVNITGVSVSNPKVTLGSFTGFYSNTQISSFPSPTLQLPAVQPAYTPLYVGATITANPGLTPGICTASFTITVTVQ